MIKNSFPNKSGNPKSLKRYSYQLESSSTNVHIVGESLLRAFSKILQGIWERDFYMKILVTIIPTNLVTNSLLSFFCNFIETKNKNQIFSKLVVW